VNKPAFDLSMPASALSSSLWETVKCDFKGLFPEDVFQMWFEPMVCLEASDDAMILGVPNDFAGIWIHDNYLDLITQRLRLTAGRMVNVTLKKMEASGRPTATLAARQTADQTVASNRLKASASRRGPPLRRARPRRRDP